MTNYRLAKDLDIPESRIGKIVKGDRRITADTAIRLEMYFGMDATFWLGLQNDYDLLEEKRAKEKQPLIIKLYKNIADKNTLAARKKNSSVRTGRSQQKKRLSGGRLKK